MICLNCGRESKGGKKFCSGCGALLGEKSKDLAASSAAGFRSGPDSYAFHFRGASYEIDAATAKKLVGLTGAALVAAVVLWLGVGRFFRPPAATGPGSPQEAANLFCRAIQNPQSNDLFRLVPPGELRSSGGREGLKKTWSLRQFNIYSAEPLIVDQCEAAVSGEADCSDEQIGALAESPYRLQPSMAVGCATARMKITLHSKKGRAPVMLEQDYLAVNIRGGWHFPELLSAPNGKFDPLLRPELFAANRPLRPAEEGLLNLRLRAKAHEDREEWAEAAVNYEQAYRLWPKDAPLALRLAGLFEKAGDSERAGYYRVIYAQLARPMIAAAEAPGAGAAGEEAGREPFFGLRAEKRAEGLTVIHVYAWGPAAFMGLARGDLLKRIDRSYLYTADDLKSTLSKYRAGDAFELVVERGGEELDYRGIFGYKPTCEEAAMLYEAYARPEPVGERDAPNLALLFSDARCKTCADAYWGAKKAVQGRPEYARLYYVHQNAGSVLSEPMQRIAQCAGREGLFWKTLDREYELGLEAGPNNILADLLSEQGEQVEKKIKACADRENFSETFRISADVSYYCSSERVPTIVLNGRPVGAAEFRRLAEAP